MNHQNTRIFNILLNFSRNSITFIDMPPNFIQVISLIRSYKLLQMLSTSRKWANLRLIYIFCAFRSRERCNNKYLLSCTPEFNLSLGTISRLQVEHNTLSKNANQFWDKGKRNVCSKDFENCGSLNHLSEIRAHFISHVLFSLLR